MSCLADWQISRLATLDGEVARDPHASACLPCRRKIGEERALRVRLQALPAPAVDPDRLRELEAVIVAIAQQRHAGGPRRRWPFAVIAAVAAAAAAIVAVVAIPRDVHAKLAMFEPAALPADRIARAEREVAMDDAPPMRVLPAGPEVVRLVDGTLELDTRGARPVEVHVGGDVVRVADSKVTIRAHARKIVSVRVLIGAAHVQADRRQFDLQRDIVWTPPSPMTAPMTALEDAWIALREGRNTDAVALFDRAGDIEEALYWGAIAARRAGEPDADARMTAFEARFPDSLFLHR